MVRSLFLQATDMLWVEHLELMEYTRGSVNLRAYGQRDPLVEYKREGLRLFTEMQDALAAQVRSLLPNIGNGAFAAEEQRLKEAQKQAQALGGSDKASAAPAVTVTLAKNAEGEKIGRNDECPCGSGKKWKKCGELDTDEHRRLMSGKK